MIDNSPALAADSGRWRVALRLAAVTAVFVAAAAADRGAQPESPEVVARYGKPLPAAIQSVP